MFTQTSQTPNCGCCAPASQRNRTAGAGTKKPETSKTGNLKALIPDKEKRHLLFALISGLSLACSFFSSPAAWSFDPAWIAITLCGTPIIKEAVVGLVTRLDVKADVLVAIALVAAVIIDEVFAAGEVAFIMSLGSLLEERTVRKAREGIEKLVNLTPQKARLIRDSVEITVPAEEVQVDDILRVLPGESIPVDGVIIFGRTAVDQSLMTGESMPVDKDVRDEVYSGTVNQYGAFDMQATKIDEDSSLQRMIRLVESADAYKTPIIRIVDRWATWIVMAALLSSVVVWAYTGEIIRAVTILVVFCPCSLILATPTAIMAGIGNAARSGVLVSAGDALERLARVNGVAFDKTGTLTYGKPEVVAVQSFVPDLSETGILSLAATMEQRSEHPLGQAIMRHAKNLGLSPEALDDFIMIPGQGIKVRSADKNLYGGTLQLLLNNGLEPTGEINAAAMRHRQNGGTVVYIGTDAVIAGLIVLADTLRAEAGETVRRLHAAGLRTTLLTGDNAQAAKNIAAAAGILDVRSELLPEDKVNIIAHELQKNSFDKICMLGDGVNDAPALKAAYVGLAMGGVGSDIAVDAADGVLTHDDITRLPQLILLARKTVRTIKVNISLSMLLNIITVALAATGLMGPITGALAHNAGALFIVLNSVRLLGYKGGSQWSEK